MSSGIWVAASGAAGQLTALDVAANNTANAVTPAFKAEQAVFREHLVDAVNAGSARTQMRYNSVAEVAKDMTTGPLRVTDRPLDIALRGEGFFAVQTEEGERYTRAGSLLVSPSGQLTTADGSPVLNTAGRPISVPSGAQALRIGEEGSVSANGDPVGQLKLVQFQQQDALERQGEQLFRATPGSGAPRPARIQVQSGVLEQSNVSIVKGMTDIVSVTRTFEALERVIEVFSQADQRAANDLMRSR